MKHITIIFICCMLLGCTPQQQKPLRPRTLIVCIQDFSLSYRNVVMDSLAVTAIINKIAETGGTLVYGIIGDKSADQALWIADIPTCDTITSTTDNIYIRLKTSQQNKKVAETFQQTIQQKVSELLAVMRTHSPANNSSIQPSLELCRTACEPLYASYNRYVIVLSDLVVDEPNNKRARLQAVDLCHTAVYIIRPSLTISSDSLKNIFPNSKEVVAFTTLTSTINYINSK